MPATTTKKTETQPKETQPTAETTPAKTPEATETTPAKTETPAAPASAEKTLYERLPAKLQKVSDAMDGLCTVLYGDGFKRDDIWGPDSKIADTAISKYLSDLPLKAEIKSTLDSVKDGISQVPPLKTAVDKILEGMGQVVEVIEKGKMEVGKIQNIVNPVIDLTEQLLPSVAEIVKAATDVDITDEVQASLDFILGAQAVTRLGFYAEGILTSLQKHLAA